ncbi:hypothetical protein MSPP1_001888 [Malassezia sp. CBS 17886]|nr:hypothetical protein MSPP1_001888 [Malassezia sp. CBS 17886]
MVRAHLEKGAGARKPGTRPVPREKALRGARKAALRKAQDDELRAQLDGMALDRLSRLHT